MPATPPMTPREQQLTDENAALTISAQTARERAAELASEVKRLTAEQSVAAGSFDIVVDNGHLTTAEIGAIVISFAIIKGVNA